MCIYQAKIKLKPRIKKGEQNVKAVFFPEGIWSTW